MKTEIPGKVKRLLELVRDLESKLDTNGLVVTTSEHGIPINQFFQNNIPGIVSSLQGLMRGEPAERYTLRLDKEYESVYRNLGKIKETKQGEKVLKEVKAIEDSLKELQKIYPTL